MQTRKNTGHWMKIVAAVTPVALAAVGQKTKAATWQFTGPGTGNWSDGGNWVEGAPPVSSNTTALVFGGSGADSYFAQQNIANPFIFNTMTITSTAAGPVVIGGSNAANSLRFAGAGAGMTYSGVGTVYVTSPLSFNANATFSVTAGAHLVLTGNHSQTGGAFGLTKTGAGTLTWGNTATIANVPIRGVGNTLAGDVNILEGAIKLGTTDGSFISDNSLINIAAGATFDFAGNGEDFGALTGDGILTGNANMNHGRDDRSTTWNGTIIGTSTARTVRKDGTGTFTVTNNNPYAHITRIAGGEMVLTGANGALSGTVSFTMDAGTSLLLDSSTSNNADRINNLSALTMGGNSELEIRGNASAATVEAIDNVNVSGFVTLTITPGAGQAAGLNAAGLVRSVGATVLFRGDNLGSAPAAGVKSSSVIFTSAPLLSGGGGPSGSPSVSILPYALGDNSSTGLGNTLVTYDPVNGIRAIDPLTEFNTYAAAASDENVRIISSQAGLAGKAISSLVVHNTSGALLTVGGAPGTPLSVGTGAVLFSGTDPIEVTGFDALDFGGVEAIISVANTSSAGASLNVPINGFAGLTKGGAGVLELKANSTYTGNTIINSGALRVGADAHLGDPSNLIFFNTGTLTASTDFTTARGINLNTRGQGVFDTAGHQITLEGAISGAGMLIKTGTGTLKLTGASPHTGATRLDAGILEISGTNNLGSGTLTFNGGTLKVAGAIDAAGSSRAAVLNNVSGNTIDTGAFDVPIGTLSGTGGFIKKGTGILDIRGANTFDGDVTILEGTVRTTVGAGSFFDDTTYVHISPGATLDVNDNPEQFAGLTGSGTVNTGVTGGVEVNLLGTTDFTFSGKIVGAGEFFKNGPAAATFSGLSEYAGESFINSGAMIVTASVKPNEPGPLGNSSTIILLGNTAGTHNVSLLMGQGVEIGRTISVRSGASGFTRLGGNHASGTSLLSGTIELFKGLELTATGSGVTEISGAIADGFLVDPPASLTKLGTGTVRISGTSNTYTGPTVVNQGRLAVSGSIATSSGVTVNGGVFDAESTQTIKSLTLNGGGTARVSAGVLTVKSDAIGLAGGTLDLNSALIIDYTAGNSPLTSVRSALASGYAGGAWNGTGIASTTAATTPNRAIGYAESQTLLGGPGQFLGQDVDADAILARFTVLGDTNLDGAVTFVDLLKVAANFGANPGANVWTDGDLNYDGSITFVDLLAVAANFGGALPASVPGASTGFNDALAAIAAGQVPEPGAFAITLAAGAMALKRRRRS